MSPKFFIILIFLVLSSFSHADFTKAQEGILSGVEIIQRSKKLLHKVEDQKNIVTLSLIERDGTKKKIVAQRLWKNYRGKDGIDSKMLLVTEFPTDSRGVGFLIWDYSEKNKTDDLWLYLPALRMVRRISAADQNDAFLGSDLTFGDMGQRRLDEDTHRFLREEEILGREAYVVESRPKEKRSIYSRKVSWISKKNWTLLRRDYFDLKQKLLKRQTITWQRIEGYDVWKKTAVKNVQNGHQTFFEVSDVVVNIGLKEKDFREKALKEGIRSAPVF